MTDTLKDLEDRIGYHFTDRELIVRALSHASAALAQGTIGYERLEFLGDRVLGLVIAELLYHRFPSEPEGDLAMRLNALVRAETCAEVALELDIGSAIRLTKGEERAGVRDRSSVLSDVTEAVIAALYLDGGLECARSFIEANWLPKLDAMGGPPRDAKTELQEWAQSKQKGLPAYAAVGRSGPDHAPIFEVEVKIAGISPVTGTGPSKRTAEQAAAIAMLQREGLR